MIRPHFFLRIAGRTRRVQRKTLRRLVPIISSHISTDKSEKGLLVPIPALLHRISTSPSVPVMLRMRPSLAPHRPRRLARTRSARRSAQPPWQLSSAPSAFLSTTPMSAPSAASTSTMARPMPPAPPVTTRYFATQLAHRPFLRLQRWNTRVTPTLRKSSHRLKMPRLIQRRGDAATSNILG